MIGLVLAAGAGRRLRPDTNTLPKALLCVDGQTTIMDISLRNLAAVGLTDVTVVVGYRADAIQERADTFERKYGVKLTLVHNDKAEEWNNAYSLWLAREQFAQGALLVNGDTVHPVGVQQKLLAARGANILLAVDQAKQLADEEMKTVFTADGRLRQITKKLPPADATGEYIGVALIEATAAPALTDALVSTWQRDPDLYYEDGFQRYVDGGGEIRAAAIGTVDWVEVDNQADLARAREIACHY